MKTLLILAFGALFALAAEGPVREVATLAHVVEGQAIPGFRDGYLFDLDHANVRVYSPQGFPAFVTVLEVPDAGPVSAKGLAVDTNGSAAVAVEYQTAKGFGGASAIWTLPAARPPF